MENILDTIFETYSNNLKKDINNIYTIINSDVKDKIKNELSQNIKNSTNYDYRKIPKIDFNFENICGSYHSNYYRSNFDSQCRHTKSQCVINNIGKMEFYIGCTSNQCHYCFDYNFNIVKDYFNTTKDSNEIICFKNKNYIYSKNNYATIKNNYATIKYIDNIILTNYSRIFIFKFEVQTTEDQYRNKKYKIIAYIPEIHEYNYWLPMDYIEIINTLNPNGDELIDLIKKISNELYLRNHASNDETILQITNDNKILTDKYNTTKNELDKYINDYKNLTDTYNTLNTKYKKIEEIIKK
jgi:hypothetical protein